MEANSISVLLIDTDAASRNYLGAMLAKSGYVVISAALGKEGLISAWRDHPNIVILDPAMPDLGGLELVTRLRQDRRTAGVPLIALSSRENPQEMTALLGAGCSEYLVKSTQAIQKLMELLPRLVSGEKPAPKKTGKLVVFLSAKGGTGTSSMCANIAMCLASEKADLKVAVMDLVLPIGSIAQIVGYDDKFNLITAAGMPPSEATGEYFSENLPRISGWSFYLLAGSPNPEAGNQLDGERAAGILKTLLGVYDYVFVDIGRSLSRISLPIIQQADVVTLILSTDRSTADLTLTVWEYLKSKDVKVERMYPIQNRAVGLEGLTKPDLEKMIGMPIRITMPYMGDNITVANNRHEPIAARFQNDSAALLLKHAALEMAEMNLKPGAPKSSG